MHQKFDFTYLRNVVIYDSVQSHRISISISELCIHFIIFSLQEIVDVILSFFCFHIFLSLPMSLLLLIVCSWYFINAHIAVNHQKFINSTPSIIHFNLELSTSVWIPTLRFNTAFLFLDKIKFAKYGYAKIDKQFSYSNGTRRTNVSETLDNSFHITPYNLLVIEQKEYMFTLKFFLFLFPSFCVFL